MVSFSCKRSTATALSQGLHADNIICIMCVMGAALSHVCHGCGAQPCLCRLSQVFLTWLSGQRHTLVLRSAMPVPFGAMTQAWPTPSCGPSHCRRRILPMDLSARGAQRPRLRCFTIGSVGKNDWRRWYFRTTGSVSSIFL